MNEFINDLLITYQDSNAFVIDQSITDRIFYFIQSNRHWMKRYLDIVAQTGNLQTVNSQIALGIERHFNLQKGDENHHPFSNLIQSYHKLDSRP